MRTNNHTGDHTRVERERDNDRQEKETGPEAVKKLLREVKAILFLIERYFLLKRGELKAQIHELCIGIVLGVVFFIVVTVLLVSSVWMLFYGIMLGLIEFYELSLWQGYLIVASGTLVVLGSLSYFALVRWEQRRLQLAKKQLDQDAKLRNVLSH